MRNKTKNAVAAFDTYAQAYMDKFMDQSKYHDSFDLFCGYLTKANAEILELGCGPGNITTYLLSKRPDFSILGTDLSDKMLQLARENNPTAVFQKLDFRKIKSLNAEFDALVCGFCLPYLSKTEAIQLIKDAASVLKPKGLFYLSTMEDLYSNSALKGPSSGGPERIFIHYHEADYLINSLQASSFDILVKMHKDNEEPDGSNTKDLILIARKN